jgi:hypothetical protein
MGVIREVIMSKRYLSDVIGVGLANFNELICWK